MIEIRVFYEDQAAGPLRQFGPHQLLCACVADRVESTIWELCRRIDGQPKKGDNKLLTACERHAKRDRDEIIFALFDGDRIHRLPLEVDKGSPPEQFERALTERFGSPKIRPFVLQNNLETLVRAAVGCLEPPVDGPVPKRHNERDKIFARAATHQSRSVRDCITNRVPSFGRLVEAVSTALPTSPPA